ncbi:hypothetical protein CNYM01_12992 [Colletotrichum nymphaeae SA-01]|uniref:Uncharacterized protein n=1 Tax=Colletotrichum nymphaeae SA-01 TaxID=1460502 RepID=A0A135T3R1_9PEZI|nr:hypothetical protein CNYM01_12992 [Colletotrichum nymphaeae SA-01]
MGVHFAAGLSTPSLSPRFLSPPTLSLEVPVTGFLPQRYWPHPMEQGTTARYQARLGYLSPGSSGTYPHSVHHPTTGLLPPLPPPLPPFPHSTSPSLASIHTHAAIIPLSTLHPHPRPHFSLSPHLHPIHPIPSILTPRDSSCPTLFLLLSPPRNLLLFSNLRIRRITTKFPVLDSARYFHPKSSTTQDSGSHPSSPLPLHDIVEFDCRLSTTKPPAPHTGPTTFKVHDTEQEHNKSSRLDRVCCSTLGTPPSYTVLFEFAHLFTVPFLKVSYSPNSANPQSIQSHPGESGTQASSKYSTPEMRSNSTSGIDRRHASVWSRDVLPMCYD